MKQENFDHLQKCLDSDWRGVSDVWLTAQTIFQGVHRWSCYEHKGIRTQDVLQHSYSITVLAKIFALKISPYIPNFNHDLLLTSFLLHDHGEGELKRDICFVSKGNGDDLDEYEAFVRRYSQLEDNVFLHLEKAYLLQYALKDKPEFPARVQLIMEHLAMDNYYEALAFEVVELWDYLLYVYEQVQNGCDLAILSDVASNHWARMSRLADLLPGLPETVWTPVVADAFRAIYA